MLWKECVDVEVLSSSSQFFHLKVKFPAFSDWVLFVGVFGCLCGSLRRQLRSKLELILKSVHLPWLLARDFNAMLYNGEKYGGSRIAYCSCRLFQNFCLVSHLKDLGSQ